MKASKFQSIKYSKATYNYVWHQNQCNLLGSRILEAFPHDGDTRKKARFNISKNFRASEFIMQLTPNQMPDTSVPKEFWDRYPDVAKIFAGWETRTLKQCFFKIEEMIDFMRKQYVIFIRKEIKAWDKLKAKNAKEKKMMVKLENFERKHEIPWSLNSKLFPDPLDEEFWKKAEKSDDKWHTKCREEQQKWF